MTNLLIDPLVLEVVRSVPSVQSLFLVSGRVLLAVCLLPLALHADAAAATAAGQAGVAGVTVLSPDQRGGQVAVSQTALAAQLRLVSPS